MNIIKKIAFLTTCSTLVFGQPVFAQSQNDQDIKSDVNAINKDNAAISKEQQDLEKDRSTKIMDKTNGNYGSQAVDSMKIGADKAKISEKKAEKDVDKKILRHHKKQVSKDTGDSDTSVAPSTKD